MRIALVLERFDPDRGGLEAWTRRFGLWLSDRGHAVTVVSSGPAPRDRVLRHAAYAASDSPVERARRASACAAASGQDIVLDTGTGLTADLFVPQTGSRLESLAREQAGYDLTTRVRRWISPGLRARRAEIAAVEAVQFRDPARVVAVSRLVRESIARRHRLDATRIAVVPNGVNREALGVADLAARRPAARARWGLGDSTVFLLVAGNPRLKGLDVALRAMQRLAAQRDCRLLMVGARDPEPWLALARRLGLETRVAFAGRIEHMADALAAADVALQPTRWDACSLATLEGLAAGLPTITTTANGAAERMRHGVHGLLTPPGRVSSLHAAMACLADPATRAAMAQAARALGPDLDEGVAFARLETRLLDRAVGVS